MPKDNHVIELSEDELFDIKTVIISIRHFSFKNKSLREEEDKDLQKAYYKLIHSFNCPEQYIELYKEWHIMPDEMKLDYTSELLSMKIRGHKNTTTRNIVSKENKNENIESFVQGWLPKIDAIEASEVEVQLFLELLMMKKQIEFNYSENIITVIRRNRKECAQLSYEIYKIITSKIIGKDLEKQYTEYLMSAFDFIDKDNSQIQTFSQKDFSNLVINESSIGTQIIKIYSDFKEKSSRVLTKKEM